MTLDLAAIANWTRRNRHAQETYRREQDHAGAGSNAVPGCLCARCQHHRGYAAVRKRKP